MTYRPLRKDLTETTRKCHFCPNYLTSLKAFVLENIETGEIVFAGPTCAKSNIDSNYNIIDIPDLTKFTLSTEEQVRGVVVNNDERNHTNRMIKYQNDQNMRRAIEYLLLREEKLCNEFRCSYRELAVYYHKHKSEPLTNADINHINNIESKAPDRFKLISLQRCYSYLFWIDVGIEKLPSDKTDFLKGIRNTIISKGNISVKQKNAVNKWLKNIPGVPQLK